MSLQSPLPPGSYKHTWRDVSQYRRRHGSGTLTGGGTPPQLSFISVLEVSPSGLLPMPLSPLSLMSPVSSRCMHRSISQGAIGRKAKHLQGKVIPHEYRKPRGRSPYRSRSLEVATVVVASPLPQSLSFSPHTKKKQITPELRTPPNAQSTADPKADPKAKLRTPNAAQNSVKSRPIQK